MNHLLSSASPTGAPSFSIIQHLLVLTFKEPSRLGGSARPRLAKSGAVFRLYYPDTQNNSATERADGTPQPKRQRTEVQTYDEMKRRGTRKRKVTYLVTDGQRAGAKRDSMAAGAATLDRTVGQRYEWRDGGLAEAKRRRGGLFGGARDGA